MEVQSLICGAVCVCLMNNAIIAAAVDYRESRRWRWTGGTAQTDSLLG